MTPCPRCTSDNTRCYGESTRTQYDENGDYDGDWDVAFYVCDDCEHDWIVTDDDVCEAYEIIDDDEDEAAFAPPADSREDV